MIDHKGMHQQQKEFDDCIFVTAMNSFKGIIVD